MFGKAKKEKQFIESALSRFLPKEKIENILSMEIDRPNIVEKEIGYILLLIDEDRDQLESIRKNVEFFDQQNAMIEGIESIYLKICVGALPFESFSDIYSTLNTIIEKYKAVYLPFHSCLYGKTVAKIGNIGSAKRMNFCVMIPKFKEKIARLINMGPNEIELFMENENG